MAGGKLSQEDEKITGTMKFVFKPLREFKHTHAMTSSSYVKGETTYKYSTKEGGWFLCETALVNVYLVIL